MNTEKTGRRARMITPTQAARIADRSYRTIMNHIHGGTLKAVRRRGSRLFEISKQDLDAWMRGEPVHGEQFDRSCSYLDT